MGSDLRPYGYFWTQLLARGQRVAHLTQMWLDRGYGVSGWISVCAGVSGGGALLLCGVFFDRLGTSE